MPANTKMKAALKKYVIPGLLQDGFTGKYPHFRREFPNYIELLSFQWNKWGNAFTVEVSILFFDQQGRAINLSTPSADVPLSELNVWYTNFRYRLKGNYDGWFYYSDLYSRRIGFTKHYFDVSENGVASCIPIRGARLVQKADENTYQMVCQEVNKQLRSAYRWWEKMRKKEQYIRRRCDAAQERWQRANAKK